MKRSSLKAWPSRSSSTGSTQGIVLWVDLPRQLSSGNRVGSHLTSVSNRSSTTAENCRLAIGGKGRRGAQQREQIEDHRGPIQRDRKPVKPLEFGCASRFGILIGDHSAHSLDLRSHNDTGV